MPAPLALIERIRALVAIPSVSSHDPELDMSNREVVELLASWAEALGLRCELEQVREGKWNLVATLGRGEGGLILSGHTDTVPAQAWRWSADPFTQREQGGRLYGLGSVDMKGFFACALEALSRIEPARLRRPVVLLATADEESTMSGAQALTAELLGAARHAVIGEATGLRPIRRHKGVMMLAVRVLGRAGHSSDPERGRNALEGMQQVVDELLGLRAELQAAHHNAAFDVPRPTLNLGYVRGGDAPNRICAACELHFDLRTLPGMRCAALEETICARLVARLEGSGLGLEVERLFACDALDTDAEMPLVRACEALTGHGAGAVSYATEGPFLADLGIETVILGPGSIEQAHRPDEFVAREQLERAADLYEALIRRLCIE